MNIPKILHIFHQIPKESLVLLCEFKTFHWKIEDVEKLLFQDLGFKIQVEDQRDKLILCVYFVLFKFGGIYINENITLLRPLEVLLNNHNKPILFTVEPKNIAESYLFLSRSLLSIDVIGSIPQHLFFKKLIQSFHCNSLCPDFNARCGNLFLTDILFLNPLHTSEYEVYSSEYFFTDNPFAFGRRINNQLKIDFLNQSFENLFPLDFNKHTPKSSEFPLVTIAILIRNKQHVLPLFLYHLYRLEYSKQNIILYIHTNNNIDKSIEYISAFINHVKNEYHEIKFIKEHFENIENDISKPHEWLSNLERTETLSTIRQKSLQFALENDSDYYFSVDCDNFLLSNTLVDLIECKKPIIAPQLHCIGSLKMSNFFFNFGNNKDYKNDPQYRNRVTMKIQDIEKVEIVHCTYLIDCRNILAKKLSYEKGEGLEFLRFCKNAIEIGMEQFVDNRKYYGLFLHYLKTNEHEERTISTRETTIYLIFNEMIQQNQNMIFDFQKIDSMLLSLETKNM